MLVPAKTSDQRKAEFERWRNGGQADVNGANKPQPQPEKKAN
jgi:hypothetical protein